MKNILMSLLALVATFSMAQSRMVPHVTPIGGNFTTRYLLINTTDANLDYSLTPYDQDGNQLDAIIGSLAPEQTRSFGTEDLFGGTISHFEIDDNPDLEMIVAYRDADQVSSSAHLAPDDRQAMRWSISPGELEDVVDGLAVVNLEEASRDIWVRQIDANGIEIDRVNILTLKADVKGLYLFQDFDKVAGARFEVFSSGMLAITALRFSTGEDPYFWQTAAVPLPALVEETNQGPVITGQVDLTLEQGTPITLELAHLMIEDPDSTEFSLFVGTGNNYQLDGTTVTPDPDFVGKLTVPVNVSDGQQSSGTFGLKIEVEETASAPDPRVGSVAVLPNNATYGISGQAVISDERTITLQNFNYNGTGPDVRLYLGKNGDYANGIDLSGLISGQSQNNATLNYTLPAGVTLDDFDGISVWCTIFLIDFSSGTFQ